MNRSTQVVDNILIDNYNSRNKLYDRNEFCYITDKMLKEYYYQKFVVINMNIWNFKIINECYGNLQGDLLLKKLEDGIIKFFENDKYATYFREYGDSFFICFRYEEKAINEFIEYMKRIIDSKNYSLAIQLYFGIKIIEEYIEKDEDIYELCELARLALKKVKGNHDEFAKYFNEDMKIKFKKRIEIINNMHKALIEEEFEVYLQPKYNLVNNCCVGAEALVRWNHPKNGFVYPSDFIPIFEENGFILKLDEYMFEKVCILIKKWIGDNKKVVPISVNISQAHFKNESLYYTLVNLIKKYEIPIELLELEITETAYMNNNEKLKSVIRRLQEYGFKIHMDDFGSGYSSLSLLSELPVDVLKMDLKFLNNLTESSKGKNIISMVVKMAKSLGVDIIAEGIESINHVKFLQNVGCTVGQGYQFCKPIRISEFENKFLMDEKESTLNDNIHMKKIDNRINSKKTPWNIGNIGKESEVLFEALAECNIVVWEYDIVHKRIIQTVSSMRVHGGDKIIEDVPDTLIKAGHIHEESAEEFRNMYKLLENGAKEASCIVKVKKKDGSYWWEKINYITSFDENNNPVRALGISNDVTNAMANKMDKSRELFKIAYKDELTDIGNRRACFNYINELINNKSNFSISYIDIDGLKNVNDEFGHNRGDEYIKLVVDIIKTSIRGDEELFRIGGDEFIYIDKNSDTDYIDEKFALVDLKIKSLKLPYKGSVSYGVIYINSNNNWSCEEIISKADKKMYISKKKRKSIFFK